MRAINKTMWLMLAVAVASQSVAAEPLDDLDQAIQSTLDVSEDPACFSYNPDALTNACVTGDVNGTTNVPTPYVGSDVISVCVLGPFCVSVPEPQWGTTAVPRAGAGGYVELTATCGLPIWDSITNRYVGCKTPIPSVAVHIAP
jgi:hypothetical protein